MEPAGFRGSFFHRWVPRKSSGEGSLSDGTRRRAASKEGCMQGLSRGLRPN
jgi:hypothetical protein